MNNDNVQCKCGSRIGRDGQHLCPGVTRVEFDDLRADLALIARRLVGSWDMGGMFGPPGENAELKRIAEGKTP